MTAAGANQSEILFERRGTAGLVTLNRPDALNAVTGGMVRALAQQLAEWEADRAVTRVILTANGQEIPALAALVQLLNHSNGQPLEIQVLRNGQKLTFTVKPALVPAGPGQELRYRIGAYSLPTKVVKLNFADAFSRSLSDNKKSSFLILELLQKMVQRKVSMRQVDGPIGIGSAVGAAAREKGWTPLLLITAAISLNLGIMNLLPIPILDGGQVVFLVAEVVRRRPLSLELRTRLTQIGFLVLVGIMLVALRNDFLRVFPHVFPR